MCFVYVLYSHLLNRYYVGMTCENLQERLRRHNTNHKGYTGKANDWDIKYFEEFENKRDALKKEREIKSRGAKRYLQAKGIV